MGVAVGKGGGGGLSRSDTLFTNGIYIGGTRELFLYCSPSKRSFANLAYTGRQKRGHQEREVMECC